ncbi:MAG TPA: adenylate/guanylate cyclase domain-containing protein, partial [Leptospiraceae bacterium]|nr:adenylate/guanylate cyclase domain-containing protein [Leptospiraceae bacterium]
FIFIAVTVLSFSAESFLRKYPNVKYDLFTAYLILSFFLAYEIAARIGVGKIIREGRKPLELIRYGNAFIETSLPSAAILNFIRAGSDPLDALLSPVSMSYFFFIILSTMRLSFGLCIFTALTAVIEYTAIILYFSSMPGWNAKGMISGEVPSLLLRVMFFLVSGLLAGLVSIQIRKSFLNSLNGIAERKQLMDIFGQHVSPAVVDRLLSQKLEMESEMRHVCILFLDIRNFTKFSEERGPAEVVNYLNALFGFMIEIINRNHGIINKFLGDGFLAVFGAPISDGKDCFNAVQASREILASVHSYCAEGKIVQTRIGIGIHSGEAVTGNVGSEIRKEYTIIGDTVNLASRIEQLNKQYGTEILISESVLEKLTDERDSFKKVDTVSVKGREEAVTVYTLI